MYPLNLMFSNPRMQRRFGQLVANENEIGGWLMSMPEPETWPGTFSWKKVKCVVEPPVRFIESFVIIPNQSQEPTMKWRAWDFQKAHAMVQATAIANRYHPIHFHTHPTGNPEPSRNDIAFAAINCQLWNTAAEFVIVTPRPLRLWPYRVEWGNAAAPDRGTWADGRFYSWHERRIRKLGREIE